MGVKLPFATLNFHQYTNTQLIYRAQHVHDALAADTTDFPTVDLPIALVDLQVAITDLKNKQAASLKGSKEQTADTTAARKLLISQLRTLAQYVNSVVSGSQGGNNKKGTAFQIALMYKSGFPPTNQPNPQANANAGIDQPQIRKAISRNPGTLYLLVRQKQKRKRLVIDTSIGRKLWQVQYRTSEVGVTPAGTWLTQTFTSSNITLTGLTTGKSYDYQVAAIGGRNTKTNGDNPINYTPIASVIIT